MGEQLSFISGLILFIVSLRVIWEYWPDRVPMRGEVPSPTLLQLGIFFGFLLTASNTFWWQILQVVTSHFELVNTETFRAVGKYMDIPFKGGMAWVGILHLQAKHKAERELKNDV